jgi:hypothetical protein
LPAKPHCKSEIAEKREDPH